MAHHAVCAIITAVVCRDVCVLCVCPALSKSSVDRGAAVQRVDRVVSVTIDVLRQAIEYRSNR